MSTMTALVRWGRSVIRDRRSSVTSCVIFDYQTVVVLAEVFVLIGILFQHTLSRTHGECWPGRPCFELVLFLVLHGK